MNYSRTAFQLAALFIVASFFWLAVCTVGDVREPWDARYYWSVAYPISAIIAAVAGLMMNRHAWLGGFFVTLAQFPIILSSTPISGMTWFALFLLILLAAPIAVISDLASRLFNKRRDN